MSAARHPNDLWSLLARELVRAVAPPTSGDLFLLSIVDGSLADPAIGTRRSQDALTLLRSGHGHEGWGHHGERADGCEQACDCPSDGSVTWHDVVARAIRDTAGAGTDRDAMPLAALDSGFAPGQLGFSPDWLEEPVTPRQAFVTRAGNTSPVDEATLLGELGDLVELLSMFGLDRSGDGAWIAPPTLRELARESLRARTTGI